MSVFDDQATFMRACGQTVGKKNREQFELYMELIRGDIDCREAWEALMRRRS